MPEAMPTPNPFKREWKSAPEPEQEPPLRLIESERGDTEILTGIATEAAPSHPTLPEDSHFVSEERGIALVADGVGGGVRGDLASRKVAQELTLERLAKSDRMTRLIMSAGRDEPWLNKEDVEAAMRKTVTNMQQAVTALQKDPEILEAARLKLEKKRKIKLDPSDPFDRRDIAEEARTMSSTASLSKVWHNENGKDYRTIAHVGDSRIYRLRQGKLERMTPDHSFVQTVVDLGLPDEDGIPILDDQDITRVVTLATAKKHAKDHPNIASLADTIEWENEKSVKKGGPPVDRLALVDFQNIVTQGIGYPSIKPFMRTDEVEDGDTELLCSDGLSDVLTDEQIRAVLIKFYDDPKRAAQALMRLAYVTSQDAKNIRAKPDDITAIVRIFRKKEKAP